MHRKNLPRIKKTVSTFLSCEDGRISKRAILRIGTVIGGAAIGKSLLGMISSVEGGSHTSFYSHSNTTTELHVDYRSGPCDIFGKHTSTNAVSHNNIK